MNRNFKFHNQQVIHGRKVIKIGYRRDVVKEFSKLRELTYDTVIFEDIPILRDVNTCALDGVKTLVLKNVGVFDESIFMMRDLETLILCGTIGYLRPWVVNYCDNLRTLIIDANVFCCEDYISIEHCPKLTHIIVRGVFPKNFVYIGDDSLSYISNRGNVKTKYPFENYRLSYRSLSEDKIDCIKVSLKKTSDWVTKYLGRNRELDDVIAKGASAMWQFIVNVRGSWNCAPKLRKLGGEYNMEKENPSVKTLKRSGPYITGGNPLKYRFSYASESTDVFKYNRRHFHLRKIAGTGYDYDKMMRLCRWVHQSIKHSGKSVPQVLYNLRCLMSATSRCGMPGNCWVMAMCLSEALLSIGIKAKYIKGYSLNGVDKFHVFVSAWSRKLKKWVFIDPTYGAWVKDMNGNLLSPSEIRYNLINDIPMQLNEDADYNGDRSMAKTYLSHYLAPYMYHMMANTFSQDETEGDSSHSQGCWISLVPSGETNLTYAHIPTSDDEYFWQPPE